MRLLHRLARIFETVLAFGAIPLLAVSRLPGRTRQLKEFEAIDLQGFDDEFSAKQVVCEASLRDGFAAATQALFSGVLLDKPLDTQASIKQLEKLTQNDLLRRQPSLSKCVSAKVNLAVAQAASGHLAQAKKSIDEAARLLPHSSESDSEIESALRAAIRKNRTEIDARIERKH